MERWSGVPGQYPSNICIASASFVLSHVLAHVGKRQEFKSIAAMRSYDDLIETQVTYQLFKTYTVAKKNQ